MGSSSSLAEAFSPTPGFSCEQGRDAVPQGPNLGEGRLTGSHAYSPRGPCACQTFI